MAVKQGALFFDFWLRFSYFLVAGWQTMAGLTVWESFDRSLREGRVKVVEIF